jgi:hypothetical protein
MNGKLPQGGLHDQTRNQLSVCHCRQPDRAGRHPEQPIFERDMKLYPAIHIYLDEQPPARPQELPDVRKAWKRRHLVNGKIHRYLSLRVQGASVIR